MAQVSSVKLSVKKYQQVEKGDEISYFQLGGSDIIMVFEKDAQVQFNDNIEALPDIENEEGLHYNYGQRVATSKKKQTGASTKTVQNTGLIFPLQAHEKPFLKDTVTNSNSQYEVLCNTLMTPSSYCDVAVRNSNQ